MIIEEKTKLDPQYEFVKVVADIKKKRFSAYCEFHIDCASELIETGSKREDIWGANVYGKKRKIEFSSLINIRPQDGNRSMEITDTELRKKIKTVINAYVIWP